ncbi:MAG: Xaa-Pro peptidase family protein [Pseudomonadota bacterium]
MPDFPDEEFEHRTIRAQQAMTKAGFDALFLTTEAEIRYFTGFRTLFWQSPTRPWMLVVPRSGKPVAVIPEIGAPLMAETWIDDIRTWPAPRPDDDGVSLAREALAGYDIVATPMGPESTLRMPMLDFRRLGVSFRDASPLILALRAIKSDAEIEAIAAICAIASSGFADAGSLFHPGQSLREAFRDFRIALLRGGADDVPYLVGGAGPEGYADVISPPSDTALQAGDVLMLDTGATRNGYFCDFDRNFALEHASDTARRAYATLNRATEAALNCARPGVTCAELWLVMRNVIGGSGNIGRYGHGLGMQLTEWPSLAAFETTPLSPGMVLTLEPSVATGPETMMVQEENIVITDGPPRLLTTRAAPELPVLT